MVNTEIRLIIFFAVKGGEALYSQQKQDWELTVAQIINSFLPNSDWNWRKWRKPLDHSVQFSSAPQSCLTLCDPMNRSMPDNPFHHQLPESTQTHVHWIDDAIKQSHALSSPSPPALKLSQHQGLSQYVSTSHQVAKVLELQLQTSVLPMNTQDWSPLGWTGWISLQSKGLYRVFSNTTVQKHQFFCSQLSW